MAEQYLSVALVVAFFANRRLGPLADEHGDPFAPTQLPCVAMPAWWDEDAEPSEQVQAATLCLDCPARLACSSRREELGTLARGVWAGAVAQKGDLEMIHYDATVSRMVLASRVTIHTPKPRRDS